ncbi:hypothetical protein D3C87_1567210 [compost metagenome]
MDRPVMVAQPDRADGDLFHRALLAAGADIFANAECVLGDEEDARHDILYQCLRAEGERQAQHAEACKKRRHIDPESAQYDQRTDGKNRPERQIAHDGHRRRESAGLAFLVLVLMSRQHDGRRRGKRFRIVPDETRHRPACHDRKAQPFEPEDPARRVRRLSAHERRPYGGDQMQPTDPHGTRAEHPEACEK